MSYAAHRCGWNRCPKRHLQALHVEYKMHRHQLNLGGTSCLAFETPGIDSEQGDRLLRRLQSFDEKNHPQLEDCEHNHTDIVEQCLSLTVI